MSTSTENNFTCACEEHLRAECAPGRSFTNAAGLAYCLRHFPGTETQQAVNASDTFTCGCDDWSRSACAQLPFFKHYEGKDYCVLHYPGTDKLEPFRAALKRKMDA